MAERPDRLILWTDVRSRGTTNPEVTDSAFIAGRSQDSIVAVLKSP